MAFHLLESGHAAYYHLQDTCMNATKEQFVGTTATMEQWHTFHYDVCFFKHVTQFEIKEQDNTAKYDESGLEREGSTPPEQPKKEFLGYPAGFVDPTKAKDLDLAPFGIEKPLFFKPGDHSFLFAGGGKCAVAQRALVIHFACGPELKVLSVAEVRQCAYVMEVAHPGPCDLGAWPAALRGLVNGTGSLRQSALEASVQRWFEAVRPSLDSEKGPVDLNSIFATAESSTSFLFSKLSSEFETSMELPTVSYPFALEEYGVLVNQIVDGTIFLVSQLPAMLASAVRAVFTFVAIYRTIFAAVLSLYFHGLPVAIDELHTGLEALRPPGRESFFSEPVQLILLALIHVFFLALVRATSRFALEWLKVRCRCCQRKRPTPSRGGPRPQR